MKTITSREFNQDVSGAKRDAKASPVFITDRGEPSHVLLSIEQYRELIHDDDMLADAFERLSAVSGGSIDFEPVRTLNRPPREADLSD